MEATGLVAAIIFGAVIALVLIVIGLPVFLYHRREVMRMRGLDTRETTALGERVAALEHRCNRLAERVTEVHMLLADEQRQMDRKLSAILPDTPEAAPGADDGRHGDKRERTR